MTKTAANPQTRNGATTDFGAPFLAVCRHAAEAAAHTEAARALTPALARALAEVGLFSMFVPRAIGGGQWSPLDGMAHLQKLAAHDAASAWVCMIGATAGLGAAYIAPQIGRDMFAAPQRITCGVFAPNGRALRDGDDYLVSGRWAWTSGAANADYIGLGCMALDHPDAAPSADKIRLLMVAREQVIFHDTWHAIGLCGTSSGDVELDQVRVPVAHSYSIADDTPWADAPLYAMPYFGFLAAGVGAVALGNARAALDDFLHLAQAKKAQGHRRILAERGGVQGALAQAEALWRSADAFYWQGLCSLWDKVVAHGHLEPRDRADLRLIATHAVRTGAQVLRAVHDLAGGTSVYRTSPIQRRLRDGETMTQHMITNAATYEMVGRVMLGGYDDAMQL